MAERNFVEIAMSIEIFFWMAKDKGKVNENNYGKKFGHWQKFSIKLWDKALCFALYKGRKNKHSSYFNLGNTC